MERFFKRKSNTAESSPSINQPIQPAPPKQVIVEEVEVNIENIPSNPGLRLNIMSYPPDIRNQNMLREKQLEKVFEGIAKGEIKTRQGLNQEMALKRPGDTRWSSHYGSGETDREPSRPQAG
ncbi:uncharacterized protein LOC110642356 [Hevea brasiliensis]|uniref:uncharacterized protein LOC110642356 n=1 Tax=Hevea brasiliensis TaxID=3981 RepID=UPI0025F2F868|nr:uncharacterized protein LOC110642356 [Hevea brasiliensis]